MVVFGSGLATTRTALRALPSPAGTPKLFDARSATQRSKLCTYTVNIPLPTRPSSLYVSGRLLRQQPRELLHSILIMLNLPSPTHPLIHPLPQVIFCDSDQVVRADLRELWHMDLQVGRVGCNVLLHCLAPRDFAGSKRALHEEMGPEGGAGRSPMLAAPTLPTRPPCPFAQHLPQGAPYGYTPFCDNNRDMEGFRFWKQVRKL